MDRHKQDKPVRTGLFGTVAGADQAVRGLLEAGFHRDQISVVSSDQHRKALLSDVPSRAPAGERAPQAALTGGAVGATLGGLIFAATAVATGGVGLLIAGPMFMAGGAVAGGLTGAMVSRGFEREITNYYDQAVQRGKILVAVEDHGTEGQSRLAEAERIFAAAGAEPVALPEG